MANYCNNFVKFKSSNNDVFEQIKKDIERYTKVLFWDVEFDQQEDNVLFAQGPTKWVPPHELLTELSKKYDVSIHNEYDEIQGNFAGHTYYECGTKFDFSLPFYEYFFYNNPDEFQYHLSNFILSMRHNSDFDYAVDLLTMGWVNTPDSDTLNYIKEVYIKTQSLISKSI